MEIMDPDYKYTTQCIFININNTDYKCTTQCMFIYINKLYEINKG